MPQELTLREDSQNILPGSHANLENNFESTKGIFQIDEVGDIRLSKLVPEQVNINDIFNEEFKRKQIFYKNFL